jgi:hypothetical protein
MSEILPWLGLVSSVAIVPLVRTLWALNQRVTRLEAQREALSKMMPLGPR